MLRDCDKGKVDNAGYESLTYLGNGELLAIFEYAANKSKAGYLINTSFEKPNRPVKFDKPLCYRITDLSKDSEGNIYGINLIWGGEYKNYIESCKCKTGLKSFDILNKNDNNLHFAQIVQLTKLNDSTFSWKPVTTINISPDKPNWEGLAVIDKYFFIISDANEGKTGDDKTHFVAIEKK